MPAGEGDSHLQEAAHSWGQAGECHWGAGRVVQEVKIRSHGQKNVCHSVPAQRGPARGCTLQTWHLWHPAEFEVAHVGAEGEAVGPCEDGHPRTKLGMEDAGI